MADHDHQRTKPITLLTSLPNITTTLSSLLTSTHYREPEAQPTSTSNQSTTPPAPASLTSYLPSTPAWFKRPSPSLTKSSPNAIDSTPRLSVPTTPIMFSLLPSKTTDEAPRRVSEDSITEVDKKRKRTSRPKTCYSICHAPPRAGGRHKIQVRARPLLQLHKLESRSRPRPAYELLPSAIFSTRLVKAISKFSTTKSGLSPTDLAIVCAERYHEHASSPVAEDESGDILALICGVGKNHSASTHVKIILEHDVEWDAHQTPSGSYEAVSTDAHGLKRTVRWVSKKCQKSTTPASDETPEKKFNFSTISANTRRHPIIAHLTSTSLEVSEVYNLPASNMSVTSATPELTRKDSDESADFTGETLTTTDELRNIIAATSIWVALCEGWCTNFRSEESLSRSASLKSVSPQKVSIAIPGSPRRRPDSIDTDTTRRSNSLRLSLRSPSILRRNPTVKDERPGSSGSSTALDTLAIPTIHEVDVPSSTRSRARAGTTCTVIVNDNARQWRSAYDDETEDEAEDYDHDQSDVKSTKTSSTGPQYSSLTLNTGNMSEKNRTGSEVRKRNFSPSTYGSNSDTGVENEKKAAQAIANKEKKKGILSKLLCGMV